MKKIIKTKRKNIDERKEFVIAIYNHGVIIDPGTKLNKVCVILQKKFNACKGTEAAWGLIPEEMPTPSLDSIKRWLRKTGIIDQDFEEKGRYWIKQT